MSDTTTTRTSAIQTAIRKLIRHCEGSQKRAAVVLDISPQYLSDILRGRRSISSRVADVLGFQMVVTFRRKPEDV